SPPPTPLELTMPAALPPFLFVGAVLLMTAGLLEGWLDVAQGSMILGGLTGAWLIWWVNYGEEASGPEEVLHAQ
ncbi:MAG: hypothetical protein RL071_3744, partial [Pseudomonadota bacterium]